MIALSAPFNFQIHVEVWLLILSVVLLGTYIGKVLAPKMGKRAEIQKKQKLAFGLGVLILWVASDWPIHDISESYLYSVHMVQHLLITFVVPPLLWIATPEWLARLIAGQNPSKWLRRIAHPVTAGLSFNALVAFTHIPWVVNTSVSSGSFHYLIHVAVFTTAMIMWLPVCGPFPELRLRAPGQMIYLFAMSLLPTIPAAFLTFASNPVYSGYESEIRVWGLSILEDQQAAGLVMKLAGGIYLWIIIGYVFFNWALKQEKEIHKPSPEHQPPPQVYGLDEPDHAQSRDRSLHSVS